MNCYHRRYVLPTIEWKDDAVVTDTEAPTPPCGPCRQLLWEYCGDIDVLLGNLQGVIVRYRLNALLPHPFDRGVL